jgi:hypothetical protein
MLRRTLGWSDAHGKPLEEQVNISYTDLTKNAGISRDMIRSAIDEALEYGFITCIRKGRAKSQGKNAINALYELHWDERPEYCKAHDAFQGFFAHEGNRTYIPNQFFDDVLRNESLSVIKVVASVIRFSIGFQTKHGFRRQQVQLSYTDIQRYAQISGRTTLSTAIQAALDRNYIVRLQEGLFTPDTDRQLSTTYAVKWSDKSHLRAIGQKIVPEQTYKASDIGQKIVPEESTPDRSENRTRDGQKIVPENRSENRTCIEITSTNNILKQQQGGKAAVAVATHIVSLLQEHGFSKSDATKLATAYPESQIQHQLQWLPLRNASKNPTGLLRKAIEENWSKPAENVGTPTSVHASTFARHFYAGLAGNAKEPITDPSSKELALAEAYVTRLLQAWNDETKIADWARDFGRSVAAATQNNANLVPTLTFALKHSPLGEQFYKTFITRRAQQVSEENERRREAHQKQHWKAYRAFLKAEYIRLAQQSPDRVNEFHRWRDATKASIQEWATASEELKQRFLTEHETARTKLTQFEEFFEHDFWKWDEQINAHSFSNGGSQE